MFRTMTEVRKAIRPGVELEITDHTYPALNGRRVVLRAQTDRWLLSYPEGHPKHAGGDNAGSWLDIPKREQVTFTPDGGLTIHWEAVRSERTGVFCTIHLAGQPTNG